MLAKAHVTDTPGPIAFRRWTFRLTAIVGATAILLAGLELLLRLCGFGYPTRFFLTALRGGQPVFVENQKFGWRFMPPALARAPQPTVIPAAKQPNTCRIFVMGESAAM